MRLLGALFVFLISQLACAQGAPGGAGAPSPLLQLVPFIVIFGVMYLLMIRPQMKKQKESKKFMEEIKKGDKIVTIGGIHGKIAEVNDTTFIIEVEGGVRLKIQKTAVSMEGTAPLAEKK